jgi:hypothetical protein
MTSDEMTMFVTSPLGRVCFNCEPGPTIEVAREIIEEDEATNAHVYFGERAHGYWRQNHREMWVSKLSKLTRYYVDVAVEVADYVEGFSRVPIERHGQQFFRQSFASTGKQGELAVAFFYSTVKQVLVAVPQLEVVKVRFRRPGIPRPRPNSRSMRRQRLWAFSYCGPLQLNEVEGDHAIAIREIAAARADMASIA